MLHTGTITVPISLKLLEKWYDRKKMGVFLTTFSSFLIIKIVSSYL